MAGHCPAIWSACPGRGAARQRCTADPGPYKFPTARRSRVCSATLRIALRPDTSQ